MLTQSDIEFMRQTRSEIVKNRTSKIIVIYQGGGEADPFTGEPIGAKDEQKEVDAVVTEISSNTSNGIEREFDSGIMLEKGDLNASVAIEAVAEIADKITAILYDNKKYEILAMDKKGIGADNRYEILARLIS